jgi:hypothetical protein
LVLEAFDDVLLLDLLSGFLVTVILLRVKLWFFYMSFFIIGILKFTLGRPRGVPVQVYSLSTFIFFFASLFFANLDPDLVWENVDFFFCKRVFGLVYFLLFFFGVGEPGELLTVVLVDVKLFVLLEFDFFVGNLFDEHLEQ